MEKWYATYTKPRTEKKAAERLTKRGWEVYCPLKKEIRQWSDRKKKVEVPFFPSYIFIRLENFEKQRIDILTDPQILNFVFWLGKPAVISDKEMGEIMAFFERYDGQQIETRQLTIGSEITLGEGPFIGQKGVVEKILKNKIVLSIPSIGCQLVVNKE